MRTFTVFAMLLVVTACGAPLTAKRVVEQPAETFQAEVALDYAEVHRRILEGVRYCFMEQPIQRQLVVRDGRDKSARTGEVVFADVYGKTGEEVHWVARTQALAEGSRLTVSVSRSKWRDQGELVLAWARGELECGRYAPKLPEPAPQPSEGDEFFSAR